MLNLHFSVIAFVEKKIKLKSSAISVCALYDSDKEEATNFELGSTLWFVQICTMNKQNPRNNKETVRTTMYAAQKHTLFDLCVYI